MSELNNPNAGTEPLFDKERYEYLKSRGLTQEEIEILEQAEAVSQMAEILPEDAGSVFDRIEALPDDPGAALKSLNDMADSDPESFAQIMAAVEAVDQVIEDGQE